MLGSSSKGKRGQQKQSECSSSRVDVKVTIEDEEIEIDAGDAKANANCNEDGGAGFSKTKSEPEPEEEEISIPKLLRFLETTETCHNLVCELDHKMQVYEYMNKAHEEEFRNESFLRTSQKNVDEILEDIKKTFVVKNKTSKMTKAEERCKKLEDSIQKLLGK